jgi:hypothetical protein
MWMDVVDGFQRALEVNVVHFSSPPSKFILEAVCFPSFLLPLSSS